MAEALKTSIRIEILNAFSAPLRKLGQDLDGAKNKLDAVKKSFSFAADLNQAAEGMGRFANGILRVLKPATDEFLDFEQAMSKVSALTNEVGSEGFQNLRKQALELGAATKYSATEAAEAQAIFGQQGLKTQQILAATPQALNLAAAGMLGIAESAEIMGIAMSTMNIPAEKTAKVVDVLAVGANAANTDVQGIGAALAYVGPIANDAHMSLELTAAAIGKLSDSGIKGTAAGTGLRAMLQRLLSPSSMAVKSMQQYGLSLEKIRKMQKDASGGNLVSVLQTFAQLGDKLPDAKRLDLLSNIFGQEASTAASVLIKASVDTTDKGLLSLIRQLEDSEGAAARTAAILQDNLKGELERTGGAINELAIKIGERMKPAVLQLALGVQDAVAKLGVWVNENPQLAATIVRVSAVAAGAALVLKGFTLTLSAAASAAGVLRWTTNALTVAYGVARAGTLALSGALWTALIPAAARAAITTKLASAALMTFGTIGMGGMIAAAAGVGIAIGMLVNHWFPELEGKLVGLIDTIATSVLGLPSVEIERDKTRGIQAGEDQVYADGSVISGTTGEILKMGTGPSNLAPSVVREARGKGNMTVESANKFLAEKRAESARQAAEDALRAKPSESRADGAGSRDVVQAVREQTKAAERHERTTREVRDELRRRQQPGAAAPYGTGAY